MYRADFILGRISRPPVQHLSAHFAWCLFTSLTTEIKRKARPSRSLLARQNKLTDDIRPRSMVCRLLSSACKLYSVVASLICSFTTTDSLLSNRLSRFSTRFQSPVGPANSSERFLLYRCFFQALTDRSLHTSSSRCKSTLGPCINNRT